MDIETHHAGCELFAGLEPKTIAFISKWFAPRRYMADEIIFQEGDEGDGFYLIHEGVVLIIKGVGICQRELRRLSSGESFGEMALVSKQPRSATAISLTDTELLHLDKKGFNILVSHDSCFAQRMLGIVSQRLHRADQVAMIDLMRAHQGLIISLAELAESRDAFTGAHLYRVRDYCTLLAKLLAQDPQFKDQIAPDFIEAIYNVSPLHDIGKVGIPDSILKKTRKLTDEEFEVIKTHTRIGARSIDTVLDYCDLKMFRLARRLILSHHEWYNGNGYPQGLKGEKIPLEARIMAIADFYDALLSKRAYKEAYSHDQTIKMITAESGKKLDPAITRIMMENIDSFKKIHLAYAAKERPTKFATNQLK
jgi:HD-GYP domain-containing protein (c-di-GMP phosphodiesterase class II)